MSFFFFILTIYNIILLVIKRAVSVDIHENMLFGCNFGGHFEFYIGSHFVFLLFCACKILSCAMLAQTLSNLCIISSAMHLFDNILNK